MKEGFTQEQMDAILNRINETTMQKVYANYKKNQCELMWGNDLAIDILKMYRNKILSRQFHDEIYRQYHMKIDYVETLRRYTTLIGGSVGAILGLALSFDKDYAEYFPIFPIVVACSYGIFMYRKLTPDASFYDEEWTKFLDESYLLDTYLRGEVTRDMISDKLQMNYVHCMDIADQYFGKKEMEEKLYKDSSNVGGKLLKQFEDFHDHFESAGYAKVYK